MGGGRVADRDELIDVLVQPGLLAVQRRPVHDRLGQRSAAAQAHAGARVGCRGSGSTARRRGRRSRSRRTAGSCAGGAASARRGLGGSEGAPAQRGCMLWAWTTSAPQPAHGGADRVGVEAPASSPSAAFPRPSRVARALEHLDLVAAAAEQRGDLGDGALLASGRPVAVVEEQDHARTARQRAEAAFWTSTAAPTTGTEQRAGGWWRSAPWSGSRAGSIENRSTR